MRTNTFAPKRNTTSVGGVFAAGLIIIAGLWFLYAWAVMISMGILHSLFGWPVTSYWESMALMVPLSVFGAFLKVSNKE